MFLRSLCTLGTLVALGLVGCASKDEAKPVAPALDGGTIAPDDAAASDASPDQGALAFTGPDPAARFASFEAALRRTARVSDEGMRTLGTTLDQELARARDRFVGAQTPADVYYALLSLKNALHDAHASYEHDPSGPLREIPSALVPKGDAVALSLAVRVEYTGSAPSYVVEGKGIPPNSVIESVDGVAPSELTSAMREWFPLHALEGLHESVRGWINYRDPRQSPAPAAGSKTTLRIHEGGPSGAVSDVALTWEVVPSGGGGPPPAVCCDTFGSAEAESDYGNRKPVASGTGYCVYSTPSAAVVRYCSFYYDTRDELVADEASLMDALGKLAPSHVLFDVRENGGGDFDPAFFATFATAEYSIPTKSLYFAPAFRDDPSLLDHVSLFMDPMPDPVKALADDMKAHPSATYSAEYPFFCRTAACAASEARYTDHAATVPFQSAVLTGPFCVSACDDFASIMHDNGLAKIVGMPSSGADSPFRFPIALEFANGKAADLEVTVGVSYRTDAAHTILEGNPPKVDVVVRPDATNRGKYLDAVLGALGW